MKEIKLTQGKIALVDDQDYDWLNKFDWHARKSRNTYYAATNIQCLDGKQTVIYIHQLILDQIHGYDENGLISDHKDRNGLNNQRYNLRRAAHGLNSHNREGWGKSKYKGVSWNKYNGKWLSMIDIKSKNKYLGYFNNEIDAAKAYDKAAKEIYGNNAVLNNT